MQQPHARTDVVDAVGGRAGEVALADADQLLDAELVQVCLGHRRVDLAHRQVDRPVRRGQRGEDQIERAGLVQALARQAGLDDLQVPAVPVDARQLARLLGLRRDLRQALLDLRLVDRHHQPVAAIRRHPRDVDHGGDLLGRPDVLLPLNGERERALEQRLQLLARAGHRRVGQARADLTRLELHGGRLELLHAVAQLAQRRVDQHLQADARRPRPDPRPVQPDLRVGRLDLQLLGDRVQVALGLRLVVGDPQRQLEAVAPDRRDLHHVRQQAVAAPGPVGGVDGACEIERHAQLGQRRLPDLIAVDDRRRAGHELAVARAQRGLGLLRRHVADLDALHGDVRIDAPLVAAVQVVQARASSHQESDKQGQQDGDRNLPPARWAPRPAAAAPKGAARQARVPGDVFGQFGCGEYARYARGIWLRVLFNRHADLQSLMRSRGGRKPTSS